MFDNNDPLFDENGDPLDSSLMGPELEMSGLSLIRGPCIGIVLSVHHSDSRNNQMFEVFANEGTDDLASALQASVLLIYNGVDMSIVLDNVLVLPQGKCSRTGPTKGEPSDWTEDVPKGCSSDEIESYMSGSAAEGGYNTLSGDWVIVDFIGRILDLPIITNWFPNPNNRADTSRKIDGRRFVLRRNNSELQIDRNGDIHLTHRVGQYLQMKGKQITIKHREGALVQLGEEGEISIIDKAGHYILVDDNGIVAATGATTISMEDDGKNINIVAAEGTVGVAAKNVNLLGETVVATDGVGGGSTVAKSPTVSSLKTNIDATILILETMSTILNILKVFPPLSPVVATLQTLIDSTKVVLQNDSDEIAQQPQRFMTSVLRGE